MSKSRFGNLAVRDDKISGRVARGIVHVRTLRRIEQFMATYRPIKNKAQVSCRSLTAGNVVLSEHTKQPCVPASGRMDIRTGKGGKHHANSKPARPASLNRKRFKGAV